VAIRISNNRLPENLIARDLGRIGMAAYAERNYLRAWLDADPQPPLRWVGEDNTEPRPNWLPESIKALQLTLRSNEVIATVEALKAGMGVGRLPVFVGESEAALCRFQTGLKLPRYPVWLLMHSDMRRVHRIRVFNDFVSDRMRRELAKFEEPQCE
jgi:DNA-binding transcriptional LysR family regulator